jgi:hypothetical protein
MVYLKVCLFEEINRELGRLETALKSKKPSVDSE